MARSAWTRFLIAYAGLLGCAGVAIGAAGAHAGGGDLARLASTFLLIHAAAICGIVAAAPQLCGGERLCRLAAMVLGIGVTLFSGDLAWLAFGGGSALRWLAPVGGTLLLLGWAMLTVVAVLLGGRAKSR